MAMKDRIILGRFLMLVCLFLTGVWCNSEFVYSELGGEALLPCTRMEASDCSLISWSFYRGGHYSFQVSKGNVIPDATKARRISITSDCSLHLLDLTLDDVGSYVCYMGDNSSSSVYVSLLTITSLSKISDLQPGGHLILSCILVTYYDVWICRSSSGSLSLRWVSEDGNELPKESRYELIEATPCNYTLVIKLQTGDNNRRWRCQLNTTEHSRTAFQDFTSAFLFKNPATTQDQKGSNCPADVPISRIVVCMALPIMVVIVGVFTWRRDSMRAKASADETELQEVK